MKAIETERLILRNFEESDYEDVFEFLSQRKEDEFEAYPDITYENGREHLAYRLHNDEFVAIQLKETGKIIGNVYLGNRDFESRELGYIINKDYQRRGYAKEAISEILKRAFSEGVHRVFAECAPENECSWKLLESLNFSREAFFKQNVYFRKDEKGQPIWQDSYVYSLLEQSGGFGMLRTKRLELVPFDKKYAMDLYELWNDFEVIKYTYNPWCHSVEECAERIEMFIDYTDKEVMNNFVILLEGKAIGIIGSPIIDKEQAKFGLYYQLVRKYWGNGYISEALMAFKEHMVKQFSNVQFKAEVVADNTASMKLLRKYDFKEAATQKAGFNRNGFCCDLIEFIFCNED